MSIKIPQAFYSAMLNGGLGVDLVFPNGIYSTWNGSTYSSVTGAYNPEINRPYVELHNFPAGKGPLSLSHSDENKGLFQAIVNTPLDGGWLPARALMDSVSALLPIGGAIAYDDQDVVIDSHRESNGSNDKFHSLVFRAEYTAFTPR